MGRKRSPERDEAFEMYRDSSGKVQLVEIASALGLPEGTIRGWKNKDDWDGALFGTLQKNTERSEKRKTNKKLIESVEKNERLNEKEKLFCFYYVKSFSGTAAARKAGYSDRYPDRIAWNMLQKPKIRDEIKRLKLIRNERLYADPMDVVAKMMKVAFADITAYVSFGYEEVPVMGKHGVVEVDDPTTGAKIPLTRKTNVVKFADSAEVDGSLLAEVRQGKDGASVKLKDCMRALLWLADYFELNPADQHKTEYNKRKLQIDLMRTEMMMSDNAPEDTADDGFIDALHAQVADLWESEDEHVEGR